MITHGSNHRPEDEKTFTDSAAAAHFLVVEFRKFEYKIYRK